jgi:hypothetical protein
MTPTISVTGLTRRYRDQLALDGPVAAVEEFVAGRQL